MKVKKMSCPNSTNMNSQVRFHKYIAPIVHQTCTILVKRQQKLNSDIWQIALLEELHIFRLLLFVLESGQVLLLF